MTLRETLDLVPDFRSSQGRRHSLGAILALATCAMLWTWMTPAKSYPGLHRLDQGQHSAQYRGLATMEEALFVARLGREVAKTDFVKLEVIPDARYLFPDPAATLETAKQLVRKDLSCPTSTPGAGQESGSGAPP